MARAQGNCDGGTDCTGCEGAYGIRHYRRAVPHSEPQSVCDLLEGNCDGVQKIVLMLSYPSDEVGNHLIDMDVLDQSGVNPWTDVLSEERYRELFGYRKHTFTGVDYGGIIKS